jgi:hypothetical protein
VHTTQVSEQEEQRLASLDSNTVLQNSSDEVQVIPPQSVPKTTVPAIPWSNCVLDEVHCTHSSVVDEFHTTDAPAAYPLSGTRNDLSTGKTDSAPSFSANASSIQDQNYRSLRLQSFPFQRDQYPTGPLKGLPCHSTEMSYASLEEACLMRHFAETLSFWVVSPTPYFGYHRTDYTVGSTHVIVIAISS